MRPDKKEVKVIKKPPGRVVFSIEGKWIKTALNASFDLAGVILVQIHAEGAVRVSLFLSVHVSSE